jgi:hypothetical protein
MGRKRKNGKQDTLVKIVVLLTALLNLIKAVVDLINRLIR